MLILYGLLLLLFLSDNVLACTYIFHFDPGLGLHCGLSLGIGIGVLDWPGYGLYQGIGLGLSPYRGLNLNLGLEGCIKF